jgi:signal transduction histidine kinase
VTTTDIARREAKNKVAVREETKAHGKQKPLHFRPAARLQYLLSEQLVSDPNVAVLEFVKNAYDADASDVFVEFDLHDDLGKSSLIIADDGSGMDAESFEQNWMHPGYSEKIDAAPTSKKRIPVGEKGLGRLAAGRLGETLDVYTRRTPSDPWFHAFFRWEDFNDQVKLLDEIPIAWDLVSEPPVKNLDVGTVVHIKSLSLRWDRRPPGRRAKGRAVTRIGRLRQDLEVLLLPLTAGGQDFTIQLRHNSELPEDAKGRLIEEPEDWDPDEVFEEEPGIVEPSTFELLDYEYEFELKRQGKGWRLIRTIRRSPEVAELAGEELESLSIINGSDLPDDLDLASVGPVSGSFFYAPEASAKAFKQLRVPTGVRIYRDGVRVDPYGDPGDDWLGASARKAIRQGHAAIQPNSLYGAVTISRKDNPALKPLANREGFIGNAALDAFFALSRQEFGEFGDVVERELIIPRWERNEAKTKSDEALKSRQWAVAMTRATAHAVRQPVTSAGAELRSLRQAIDGSPDIPEQLRLQLQDLYERTKLHLSRIDDAVGKMLAFLEVDPEPKRVDLIEIVGEVVDKVAPDAESAGIDLYDDNEEDAQIPMRIPAGLVEHALEELLENAIQASRPKGRKGWVRVEIAQDEGVRIQVADNAGGIDDKLYAKLFNQTVSKTGRIGVGLLINRQLMQIARGDIELIETGPEGSIFSITLPS